MVKKPNKKTLKKKEKKSKGFSFKRTLVLLFTFLLVIFVLLILGFFGAVFAHKNSTIDKTLYGVNFMGEDVGGLTSSELKNRISERLSKVSLSFKIEGETLTFSAEEAGIIFDESIIATKAFSSGRSQNWFQNFLGNGNSFVTKHADKYLPLSFRENEKTIPASYQINNQKLESLIAELSKKYNIEEKNAGLVMNGSTVRVIPAVFGRQLVTGAIRTQIEDALNSSNAVKIVINTEEVDPSILENDVQGAIKEAEKILTGTVTLNYQDKTFQPTKEIIGSWIIFTETNGILEPKIDTGKVRGYLLGVISKEINIAPVNQVVKITNGRDREVTREGKDGLAVNVDSLANEIATSLNAKNSITRVVPTYVVNFRTEVNNVLVADWSRYIEVSIARQEMCAYLAGGEKINCWSVTTGAAQWPTPRGTFLIMRKVRNECMPNVRTRDPNDRLCNVNYVSYFTRAGHAIHEAWWRSNVGSNAFGNPNFGINGSAGCVNAPYDVAKFIYNWAPLGTPVVVH